MIVKMKRIYKVQKSKFRGLVKERLLGKAPGMSTLHLVGYK
jgi:hypothetical protein